MLAAIRQWVIKTMMKGQTGVVQSLPKREIIEMNVQITAERMLRNGINPNDLKTVGQVENVVKQIEQPRVNVNTGMTSVKKADVMDMEGNKISEGSKIMGGKEVKPIDELQNYTKSKEEIVQDLVDQKFGKGYFDDVDGSEEAIKDAAIKARLDADNKKGIAGIKINLVDDSIAKIKSMEPMDAMKEANLVAGKKGRYANLDDNQVKKIMDDTNDHIFERDIPDEDFATGGRVGLKGGSGFLKFLKKFKVKQSGDDVKEFLSKRQFMKDIVGNTEKNKKARELRMLKEAADEARRNPGFKFKNVDIEKDIKPIFDRGLVEALKKNRKLNADGGVAGLLGKRPGYRKGLLVNEMLEMTYPDQYYKDVIEPAKTGKGPVPSKTQMMLKSQPIKATTMQLQNLFSPGKYDDFRASGTPLAKKAIGAATKIASKGLGPLSFLFDTTAVADSTMPAYDSEEYKALMAREAQFKKQKQQEESFQKIKEAQLAKDSSGNNNIIITRPNKSGGDGGGHIKSSYDTDKSTGGSGDHRTMKSYGGRIGYKAGSVDKMRRLILKAMGAGTVGIGAAKSGIFSFGKGATKQVAKEVAQQTTSSMPPPYFFKLAEKIKKMGDDVTAKSATKDREVVTKFKEYELTEDVATGEMTIQRMKIDDNLKYDASEFYGKPVTEDVYMNYKPGKGQADETTGRVADEYTEDTSLIRSDKPAEGGIEETFDGVPDDILEEVGEAKSIKYASGGLAYMLGE